MSLAVRLNVITYPVEAEERAELDRVGADLLAIEGQRPEEILETATDCDALLVVSAYIPGSVIERLTQCRVISRLGAGTDRIDIEAATRCGIVVVNVPDFCLNEQAEHTMALLLAFARRLPRMTAAMLQCDWSARHDAGVHRVAGRALGLLGFGAGAKAVAERARGFGLRLLAWARTPDRHRADADRLGVELLGLDQVIEQSDFLSIHLPLTPETRHLIDAARLARMKPTSVLVNTARGPVVDEGALIDALRSKRIAGAALDVFEGIDVFNLPPESLAASKHPLMGLDNVILTPHCAGSSVESTFDSKIRGARNAAAVLAGKWPASVVNPGVRPRSPLG